MKKQNDLKGFYDSLHLRPNDYTILIKSFNKLTIEDSISAITHHNFINCARARESVSRALFTYFNDCIASIFSDYSPDLY